MRMMRCKAEVSIAHSGGVEHLWPGLEVNLDRELAPGFTIAHAVAGREGDWFEPAQPAVTSAVEDTTNA